MKLSHQLVILVLLIASIAPVVNARNNFIKGLSVELWDGLNYPLDKQDGTQSKIANNLGVNFMYTFDESPWDCGIFMQSGTAKRKYTDAGKVNCRSTSFGITGNYNFLQKRKFHPFAGIGLGPAYNYFKDSDGHKHHSWAVVCVPRIGVEMWQFVRVTAYVQLTKREYSTFGVSLGLVFGK